MFFSELEFLPLFIILVTIPFTQAETLSSTTDAVEISTRSISGSNSNTTQDQEQEWRSNESNQENHQPAEKVISIDGSLLNKYRRDGIENRGNSDDYNRHYFSDFPDRYHYENELYHRDKNQNRQPQQYQQQQYQQQQRQHQYQQQYRNRDEAYPVTIQGCSHSMQDVSRPPTETNMPFQNHGILHGWLAGSGWHSNHATDYKRYESSYPLQVTTAIPKIAPYRNRDYTKYDFSYHDKNGASYKPRYDPEARVSATRDYYNSGVHDIQQNPPNAPNLMQSYPQQHQHRNNRIVYYEYNLDDRRPSSGRCHSMDQNCGSTNAQYGNRWYSNAGSSGHGSRFDGGHRFQISDEYNYHNQQQHPYHSRFEDNRNEDSREPQVYSYLDEDSYRYRNDRHGGGHQNNDIGYVYSIDLPTEQAIRPSTAYTYDMEFARKNQGYRHTPVPRLDT